MSDERRRQRLAALGLLGVPLLTYPVLQGASGEWGAWPLAFVYLFGVWGILIGAAALIAEREAKR